MNTKPFEPKLPLPEAFESQLMKSAIAQLQPIVNQYLTEKPLFLPENVAPLAAAPVVNLWSTGNGKHLIMPILDIQSNLVIVNKVSLNSNFYSNHFANLHHKAIVR